jgi:hypothetical protein
MNVMAFRGAEESLIKSSSFLSEYRYGGFLEQHCRKRIPFQNRIETPGISRTMSCRPESPALDGKEVERYKEKTLIANAYSLDCGAEDAVLPIVLDPPRVLLILRRMLTGRCV